jgi:triple functional domain protein
VKLLIQLADSLVEKNHFHAADIQRWVCAVDERYKDFSCRMDKYRAELEGALGIAKTGGGDNRNSDSSLEGKVSSASSSNAGGGGGIVQVEVEERPPVQLSEEQWKRKRRTE